MLITTTRKYQISLNDTPYYHIVFRCVRRAYLCGTDNLTGKYFEHRRQWVEGRIRLLSSIFGIEYLSYAVMKNHYYIVLKVDQDAAENWSLDEVIFRWLSLHKGPLLAQKYQKGDMLTEIEMETLKEIVESWRKHLFNISDFMQQLNQIIARQANTEKNCTGRFWKGRFKSHVLRTEEAILTAMAYIDLNPIRAV